MPALSFPSIVATALVVLAGACVVFDRSGVEGLPVDATVDAPSPDAPPPDATIVCEAGQTSCDGHVLVTCDESGTSITEEPCFLCDESGGAAQCLHASHMPAEVYTTCASEDHALTPPAGSMVTMAEPSPGAIELQCDMGCGNGASAIQASHVIPGVGAWFCLSRVDIPADVTVGYAGRMAEPMVWLVDDSVTIAGMVDLSGGDASFASTGVGGGDGGPGGFAGGDQAVNAGENGAGPCAGTGGGNASNTADDEGGGGGGGGGFDGTGGTGGTGMAGNGLLTAAGGAGGGTCGAPKLVPLQGGSGGGSGGDGGCFACGWSGGGGGGALGIAARTSITITGTLAARGGNGFGSTINALGDGGGGGGGAGGALLLEAPMLSVAGNLVVDGGSGGVSAAGNGGNGATVGQIDGANGTDHTSNGDGGSGGGGGGGRIRLNTPDSSFACSDFASPRASCTAGGLQSAITP